MHKMFLLFVTLNGQPVGNTQMIQPVDSTCRQEFNMVRGLNQASDNAHDGLFYYGSCEPVKD